MALLTKRSTVLGLPIGGSQPAWGKIAGMVAALLAVLGVLATAATRGGQQSGGEDSESEGEGSSEDEESSGDQGE